MSDWFLDRTRQFGVDVQMEDEWFDGVKRILDEIMTRIEGLEAEQLNREGF